MASAIPSLLVAYEGDTGLMGFTSTSQGFFMLGSGPNLNNVSAGGSETDAQTPFPAGTISNLWCRVKTAATANSTVILRKNSSNGNETFSIGANATGAFSDATDTDSTVSGDKIAVGITPGSTALVITIIAATFTSTNMPFLRRKGTTGKGAGKIIILHDIVTELRRQRIDYISSLPQLQSMVGGCSKYDTIRLDGSRRQYKAITVDINEFIRFVYPSNSVEDE
jgi:hypothetical protein